MSSGNSELVRSEGCCSSYRLWLVLKDLPGLLLVAQLLNALPLQVALFALLKQRVGSPVPAQELGGCALAQDLRETKKNLTHSNTVCKAIFILSVLLFACSEVDKPIIVRIAVSDTLTCVINTSRRMQLHYNNTWLIPAGISVFCFLMTDGWWGWCLHGQSGQPNYSSVNWPEKKVIAKPLFPRNYPLVTITSSPCWPSIVSRCRRESWPLTLSVLHLLLSCLKLLGKKSAETVPNWSHPGWKLLSIWGTK